MFCCRTFCLLREVGCSEPNNMASGFWALSCFLLDTALEGMSRMSHQSGHYQFVAELQSKLSDESQHDGSTKAIRMPQNLHILNSQSPKPSKLPRWPKNSRQICHVLGPSQTRTAWESEKFALSPVCPGAVGDGTLRGPLRRDSDILQEARGPARRGLPAFWGS